MVLYLSSWCNSLKFALSFTSGIANDRSQDFPARIFSHFRLKDKNIGNGFLRAVLENCLFLDLVFDS